MACSLMILPLHRDRETYWSMVVMDVLKIILAMADRAKGEVGRFVTKDPDIFYVHRREDGTMFSLHKTTHFTNVYMGYKANGVCGRYHLDRLLVNSSSMSLIDDGFKFTDAESQIRSFQAPISDSELAVRPDWKSELAVRPDWKSEQDFTITRDRIIPTYDVIVLAMNQTHLVYPRPSGELVLLELKTRIFRKVPQIDETSPVHLDKDYLYYQGQGSYYRWNLEIHGREKIIYPPLSLTQARELGIFLYQRKGQIYHALRTLQPDGKHLFTFHE